jgi:hypothetical protein
MNYFTDGSRFAAQSTYGAHTVEGGDAEGFRRAIGMSRVRLSLRTHEPGREEVA